MENYTNEFKIIKDTLYEAVSKLPKEEQEKVDMDNIYMDNRTNSVQFDLEENESTPNFYLFYSKNKGAKMEIGAAMCRVSFAEYPSNYVIGAYYHEDEVVLGHDIPNKTFKSKKMYKFAYDYLIKHDSGGLTVINYGD